jgi:hypothetical protein
MELNYAYGAYAQAVEQLATGIQDGPGCDSLGPLNPRFKRSLISHSGRPEWILNHNAGNLLAGVEVFGQDPCGAAPEG